MGLNKATTNVLYNRAPKTWLMDMVPEDAFKLIDKLTQHNYRSHERVAGIGQAARADNEQFSQFLK